MFNNKAELVRVSQFRLKVLIIPGPVLHCSVITAQ